MRKRVQSEMKRLQVGEVGAVHSGLHVAGEADDEILYRIAGVSDRNVQANGNGPALERVVPLVGLNSSDGVAFVFVGRKFDSDHVLHSRQWQGLGDRKAIGALLTL